MDSAIIILFQLVILLFSVVIHEVAHGLTANALGDPTAKDAGRLTLNPLRHIDPMGSVLFPLLTAVVPALLGGRGVLFGWAKPVPYNPYYLRLANKELGSAIVGFAGPAANILVAVFFGFFLRLIPLGIAPVAFGGALGQIASWIVLVNLSLAVFNLLPVPPLDGSRVLFFFLPRQFDSIRAFLEQFGFYFLLFFIFALAPLLGYLARLVELLYLLITGVAA